MYRPTSYRVPSIDKPDIIYFVNICRFATCNATDSVAGCFGCTNVNSLNTFAIVYNSTAQSCSALTGNTYSEVSYKWNVNATTTPLPIGQTDVRNGFTLTYTHLASPTLLNIINIKMFCDTANIPWYLPADAYGMSNAFATVSVPGNISASTPDTMAYTFGLMHRYACPDWFTQAEVVDLIAPIIVFGVALCL